MVVETAPAKEMETAPAKEMVKVKARLGLMVMAWLEAPQPAEP
jgi:hypothetical protein